MLYILLILFELLVVFFLSRTLTNSIFALFYKISKSIKTSANLIGFVFIIGTLIHELAHTVMAFLLMVRVGKMELWPRLHENGIKLGSVQIEKTDPVRRMMIGMAPFLFGLGVILGLFAYGIQKNLFSYTLFVIFIVYITFQVANTMFSSKKDMEGTLELIITTSLITAILYFAGIPFPNINISSIFLNPVVEASLKKASIFLTIPIVLDLAIITILRLFK